MMMQQKWQSDDMTGARKWVIYAPVIYDSLIIWQKWSLNGKSKQGPNNLETFA